MNTITTQVVRGTSLMPVRALLPRQLLPVPARHPVMPEGWRFEQVDGVWRPVLTVECEPS